MKRLAIALTFGLLVAHGGMVRAEYPPWEPSCNPPPPSCSSPLILPPSATLPGMTPPGSGAAANQGAQAPGTDAFAQAPPAGAEATAMALPNLIGDQNAFIFSSNGSATPTAHQYNRSGVAAALAQAGLGAFKITENESPAPQDRVFITYNYFYNINKTFNPSGIEVERTDLSREVIGFEKTFLGGDASFGMRLPIIEAQGQFIDKTDVGDISMILKYAFVNDRSTGNLLSTGLVLTVPTGPAFVPDGAPDIHPVLFQPFLGSIWRSGDFYLHGFTSILVPTDNREVTFLFNDYGIGYFIYQSNSTFISSIAPTVEAHLNTPLNHRGSQEEPIAGLDVFDLTSGFDIGFGNRAFLTIGIDTPLTGPKPFDVEAVAQFNWRF
jgi:hypothetical protein